MLTVSSSRRELAGGLADRLADRRADRLGHDLYRRAVLEQDGGARRRPTYDDSTRRAG